MVTTITPFCTRAEPLYVSPVPLLNAPPWNQTMTGSAVPPELGA